MARKEKEPKVNKVKEKKQKPKKLPNIFLKKTELAMSTVIEGVDYFNESLDETLAVFWSRIVDLAALLIIKIDHFCEWFGWIIGKGCVLLLRSGFDFRMYLHRNKKIILEMFAFVIFAGVILSTAYSRTIAYEYAYNDQVLGIVEEERYVTEIIELMGGELSDQHGRKVRIDPKLDIKFKPTLSINKSIDSMDEVLSKFCTVSNVKVTAYGIYRNDTFLVALSSEKAASSVLEKVQQQYMNDYTVYTSVSFQEKVEIKELVVSLSEIRNEDYSFKFLCTGGNKTDRYEIATGDTIDSIAKYFGLDVATFKELNPEIGDLTVGDIISVRTNNPLLTVLAEGTSTYNEDIPYEVEEKKSDNYYETYKFTEVEGENGKKEIVALISQVNGEVVSKNVISEKVLEEPKTKIIVVGSKELPPSKGTGRLLPPLVKYGISAKFGSSSRILGSGNKHKGIDLTAKSGTPIFAADGGEVIFAGDMGTSGLVVIIDHGKLLRTKYGHCSKLAVVEGQMVQQGEVIAYVGHTGIATGSHLHFEVQYNREPVNPTEYVDFD